MKKLIVPLSVTVIISLLILIYFLFLRSANVYDAIPDSAVAVIEISDWNKFSNQVGKTQSGTELVKTDAFIKLQEQAAFFGRVFGFNPSLQAGFSNGKIAVSTHLTSATDFDYLFIAPAKGIENDDILKALNTKLDVSSVNKRSYKDHAVVDVAMKDGKRFTFTIIKKVIVCSFTSFLTENSVTAITNGYNLSHDKDFNKLIKKFNSSSDVKLFINFKKADIIFPVVIKPQKMSLLNDVHTTQTWAGYGVTLDDDRISFNGLGVLAESMKASATPKNILANTIWNSLPDNAAYVNVGFNDLKEEAKANPGASKLLKDDFKNWLGDAHAFITLEPLKEDLTEYNVFITQVADEAKALEHLKHLISLDGSASSAVDTCMHLPIFHLKDGSVINQIFGSSFTTLDASFFVVGNHIAIFCSSPDILKFTLEKISRGETLNKDASLRRTIGNVTTGTGVVYINPSKAGPVFRGLMNEGSTLPAWLSRLSGISLTTDVNSGWYNTKASFCFGSGTKASEGLLWKTKLQTLSTYCPQILVNGNTGDKEIFTQDTANNVYLLSKSGEVLFTKNIGESIIGAVYQLDYYNNGKLQYIFNSATHVFMLDRSGNDAASYPLRLSYPASAGLTLVNSGSKYRYYVPCTNGAVYGYEATGRPLSGWSPLKGVGVITKQLQSFKYKKSELILAFNNAGKLMLLDTKGAIKWGVDNLPVTNQNFNLLQTAGDFMALNAAGNQLIEISSDGNDNIKPVIDSAFSFAATTTSDSTFQYFYSNQHDIRAYNEKNAFQNAVSLKSSLISSLEVVTISGTKYLLVKDESAKKVMVYNLQLKPVADYPVANMSATTLTDLFDHNELIAIQPDANGNITCYRIK